MLILTERAVYTNYMYYYEVAPLKIVRANQHVFTYSHELAVNIGQLVTIPIGKGKLTGLVVKKVKKPTYATKSIDTILDIKPIPLNLVMTAQWISEYYSTHLATVLQTVLPRGLTKKRRIPKPSVKKSSRIRTNFVFNSDQKQAISQIENMTPGTAILHGITGSGKTAVYIELVKKTLQADSSAIVLVPEIALTSQLVSEFQNHFDDIILTHSKQTEAERHLAWTKALSSSKPSLVVGPRSALFIPVSNLGMIIIDEAHEPSYKQDQSPRYSALRVASVLASHSKAKVVQGSATPLVAEYYLAKQAQRPIITMQTKANPKATDSTIELIDMTKKHHFTEHRLFSNELLMQLRQNLEQGKQSLIFHNRRGSANTTLCEQCGWSAICPRCFIPFTLHADKFQLSCHICGNTARVPTSCPDCQSTDIIHKGIGTKLIESELKKLLPAANIARFDGDTANTETVESRYGELYDGTIDIIIGTQVIAKGLDLPRLNTVGVIQADAGLSMPDFGASERTFQLLAQVIGRVGRGEHKNNIIVQSYQPSAPAVQLGLKQDYREFYDITIKERRRAIFPPFTYLLKLTCVYKTEAATIRNSKKLATSLRIAYKDIAILGPTPAFYERQRDTYRWQIIIKSSRRSTLNAIANNLPPGWQYDIDPNTLL